MSRVKFILQRIFIGKHSFRFFKRFFKRIRTLLCINICIDFFCNIYQLSEQFCISCKRQIFKHFFKISFCLVNFSLCCGFICKNSFSRFKRLV